MFTLLEYRTQTTTTLTTAGLKTRYETHFYLQSQIQLYISNPESLDLINLCVVGGGGEEEEDEDKLPISAALLIPKLNQTTEDPWINALILVVGEDSGRRSPGDA